MHLAGMLTSSVVTHYTVLFSSLLICSVSYYYDKTNVREVSP